MKKYYACLGFWIYLFSIFILCLYVPVPIYVAGTLFYIIPALVISRLLPEQKRKSAFAALIFSIIWLALELIWQKNLAWTVFTSLPFKLLGTVPTEDVVWAFLWFYFVTMFYEYFTEKDARIEKTSKLTQYTFLVSIVFLPIVFYFQKFFQNFYYSYVVLGALLIVLPVFIAAFKRLQAIRKLALVFAYFFVHSLLFEILALKFHYWQFNSVSGYIGSVSLFGFTMPFEEFFFFIILGAPALVLIYELLDDDGK